MLFFGLGFGPRAEGWGAGFRIESYCTSWRVSIRFEDVFYGGAAWAWAPEAVGVQTKIATVP